jgi:glyceraldehyde-3-phosphate dehydrogenase (NAD(P))
MKVKIGINGYGTIGKRVAYAIKSQPDMEIVGIVKTRPNWEILSAIKEKIPIYVPSNKATDFENKGIKIAGTVEDIVNKVDVIIDCTPKGVGAKYKELYEKAGVKAVFQGGESHGLVDVSFNSLINYRETIGKRFVRVVSCNTTGLLRIIAALRNLGTLRNIRAFIVRRGADLKEIKKGPIEGLILDPPKPPSHHALDVLTVVKDLNILTYAIVAPTTLAHMHIIRAEFEEPITYGDVINALNETPRILLVKGSYLKSTAELRELAKDLGRPRGDIYENVVWEDSIYVNNNELLFVQAIHQEAIVVPENIDAVRAITSLELDPIKSITLTDRTLNIKRWLP